MNYLENIGKVLSKSGLRSLTKKPIRLVKLTNPTENHNGFQFKTGLNVDHEKFEPTGGCKPGGIYFTDIDNLSHWLRYNHTDMKYCRYVSLLPDSQIYIEDAKMKADKIILSDRIDISDLPQWTNKKYCLMSAKQNRESWKYIKNFHEDVLLAIMEKHSGINFILQKKIPITEKVQLEAVKENGCAIEALLDSGIKVSENVKLAAVKENGYAIACLLNNHIEVSEKLQLEAVKEESSAVTCLIDNNIKLSDKVQLAAVSGDGCAIEHLLDSGIQVSEKVQLAAVSENGHAIRHLLHYKIDVSEDVQVAAIKSYYDAIFYLMGYNVNISEKVKNTAIEESGLSFEDLKTYFNDNFYKLD